PNEKIHLHTDRSLYMGGDTLWFRAYLVNALDNKPEKTSRYVYAELVNPFGNVVNRVKIRQDTDSLYYGYLPLDIDLPGGEYTIRAYTRYMENSGESFFFRKPVRVVQALGKSVKVEVDFSGKAGQKQVKGVVCLKNMTSRQMIKLENVSFFDEKGKIDYWTEDGQCHFKITPDDYKQKVVKLEAANFQQFLPVDLPEADYHVDFLPEGGNLPAGVLSKMAFKALNSLGQSEEVSGIVKDESGNVVCKFQTTHAGMGAFNWIPEAGKKYYAECTSEAGVTRRFDLPVAHQDVVSLNVIENRGGYVVSIRGGQSLNETPRPFILLVHERGLPLLAQEIDVEKPVRIKQEGIASGVLHFVLLSSAGNILSERLAFVKNDDQVCLLLRSDKEMYGWREKVNLSVALQDVSGNPLTGSFSVSVTDTKDLLPDSTYTIYTTLLLASELKGYIEEPGWYFYSDEPFRREGLDLLMLTQGWRSYRLEQALVADYQTPAIAPELYQRLTGDVKRLVGNKVVKGAKVTVNIPDQGVLEEVKTDEKGCFDFSPFEFPDSTLYSLHAVSAKGSSNVLLSLSPEKYPAVEQAWPFMEERHVAGRPLAENVSVDVSFMDKSNRRVSYENGLRSVFLEDVVVTAKKKVYKTPYESIPSAITIKEEELKKTPMTDLQTFLTSRLPGLIMQPSGLYRLRDLAQQEPKPITIILNGFPVYDLSIAKSILENTPPQHIEQIDYNRDPAAGLAWFPMTGASFIAITLKMDVAEYDYVPKNVQMPRLLGYQKPAAFYSPKYETMQQKENPMPDLRTTLYWNPKVQTDEQGNASVEFYTADSEAPFSVVVEGITDDGWLIRGKW
uniref:TonB-dependent receptor n=1 Tax=Parabacteroides goldsteinii TaxID=328812 RepID=UPI00101CCAB1